MEIPSDLSIRWGFRNNLNHPDVVEVIRRASEESWSHTKMSYKIYLTMASLEMDRMQADLEFTQRKEEKLRAKVDELLVEREESRKKAMNLKFKTDMKIFDLTEKLLEVKFPCIFCTIYSIFPFTKVKPRKMFTVIEKVCIRSVK